MGTSITKVVIQNYRCLSDRSFDLNDGLNIIVGDNECGKSTFLEAVHLALTGQLNGRSIINELHPDLFSTTAVKEWIDGLNAKAPAAPPSVLIEVYFADDPTLTRLKGTNNSQKADCPGVKLSIHLSEDYKAEYAAYVADPPQVRKVPVEYYVVSRRDFADNNISQRPLHIRVSFIDASAMRNSYAASRYVIDAVKTTLGTKKAAELALAYRTLKDKFLQDPKVAQINEDLANKRGVISDKTLAFSLDISSRANWESAVVPHLDDIPLPLAGKGEQNSVNIKLAMTSSEEAQLVLIEEPENHLSFSRLNMLVSYISERTADRQLLITTHSSFVLNKLGLGTVLLFSDRQAMTLKELDPDTQNYFLKLPGYDTLRLILSKRAILVEGPSDELIVQKAFLMLNKKRPIENGVDVISVGSLAFKRFLEIAKILKRGVDVVTDNDGDVAKLNEKYKDFVGYPHIRICFDKDENAPTLENQLLKSNTLELINSILGKSFGTKEELLNYMRLNKTDSALKLFETRKPWKVPEYIQRAVLQ